MDSIVLDNEDDLVVVLTRKEAKQIYYDLKCDNDSSIVLHHMLGKVLRR